MTCWKFLLRTKPVTGNAVTKTQDRHRPSVPFTARLLTGSAGVDGIAEHISAMTDSTRRQLEVLRRVGLQAAGPYTSCDPYEYAHMASQTSPLWGHCAAMAYLVQAVAGGVIVQGRVKGISHYWNRLPDGTEIDLTSCQFGGDGWTPLKKGRKAKVPKRVNTRFILFAMRVEERIKQHGQD